MGARDYQVLESFKDALSKSIRGFRKLPQQYQWQLAHYIYESDLNYRRHKEWGDHMSISYAELNSVFGRGVFQLINDDLELFSVTRWIHSKGRTKGYKLTDKVQNIKDKYLSSNRIKPSALVDSRGKVIRTIPKAIAAKDSDGNSIKAWKNIKITNQITVDLDTMNRYKKLLQDRIKSQNPELWDESEKDKYRLDVLSKLIRQANTDLAGRGVLIQRYRESPSGRLYGMGTSLQRVPTRVRQAALNNYYDYDIENCHYAIFTQLAAKQGLKCEAINHYIAHKKAVRNKIAKDVGIDLSKVKMCFSALLYGAKTNPYPKNAISKEIGEDKARLLFKHDGFMAIHADVLEGRSLIVSKWVRSRGKIFNAMDLSIDLNKKGKDTTPEQLLAHISQGIEAKAIRSIAKIYPEDIALLMHDGFVSKRALDVPLMEQVILAETGLKLELSQELIQIMEDGH